MPIDEVALVCGLPYSGKSELLEKSGEPFLKWNEFLQKKYKTLDFQAIELNLSLKRKETIKEFAELTRKLTLEMEGKRFWIEGRFIMREERLEMKNVFHEVGFKRIGCLVLHNVKISELLNRCEQISKNFSRDSSDLMWQMQNFEIPSRNEGFAWIDFIQPADSHLREISE